MLFLEENEHALATICHAMTVQGKRLVITGWYFTQAKTQSFFLYYNIKIANKANVSNYWMRVVSA